MGDKIKTNEKGKYITVANISFPQNIITTKDVYLHEKETLKQILEPAINNMKQTSHIR